MRRHVLALSAANALLAITLVLGIVLEARGPAAPEPLIELELGGVDRIVLTRGSGRMEIRFDRGEWSIFRDGQDYPARADRVNQFLEAMNAARVRREVTRGGDPTGTFGLGDAARSVALSGDWGETRILFGRDEGREIYAQMAGSDRVLLATGSVGFYLEQSDSFWAYLRLLPESARADEVDEMRVVESGATRAVADPAASRALLDLVGSGFYEGELPALPERVVVVSVIDGRSWQIVFYRLSDGTVVAVPDGPALPGERYGGLRYAIAGPTADRVEAVLGVSGD